MFDPCGTKVIIKIKESRKRRRQKILPSGKEDIKYKRVKLTKGWKNESYRYLLQQRI
jgi:hypothetical protein